MINPTIHVFNPEHDLALAVGKPYYTPPERIKKLRKHNSLLPARYACNGDFILILDEVSKPEIKTLPYFQFIGAKNITVLTLDTIETTISTKKKIMPWGWDAVIKETLFKAGIPLEWMPSSEEIESIRNLSHRRNIIPFREAIATELNEELINLPKELFSLEEVEKFLSINPDAYFKAPWSSSGRGITVSSHISRRGLLEWCHGIIKQQGSVMGEPQWQRIFDFATEWIIKDHSPAFLGYSVFNVSERGKYHSNVDAEQRELENLIKDKVPAFNENIISAQQESIKRLISPYYNGYLGIDMLADSKRKINPAVELNLRLTMGHVPLLGRLKT